MIMANICGDETLEKQRYFVEHAGTIWHIDVYGGVLKGVVIAEITLGMSSTRRSIWRRRVVPLGLQQQCRNEASTLGEPLSIPFSSPID